MKYWFGVKSYSLTLYNIVLYDFVSMLTQFGHNTSGMIIDLYQDYYFLSSYIVISIILSLTIVLCSFYSCDFVEKPLVKICNCFIC